MPKRPKARRHYLIWNQVMPDPRPFVPADLKPDLAIVSIRSTIVDVPTVRRHELASLSVTAQSYVIVELRLANGVEGIGEAATLGGPRWSEESVESIKSTIDAYLGPAWIGAPADRFQSARTRMDASANAQQCRQGGDRGRVVRCGRQ